MSLCIKCSNINNFIQKGNKLYKECTICKFTEQAKKDEYKILSKDYAGKGDSYETFLGSIIQDKTCPTKEINGKTYSIFVEKDTLKRIYVSHDDQMAYFNLEK